jgi:hypothetical protein
MKKIILLFTIVCVGQLYGMEPTYHTLPKELQNEIVSTALATSKSVDDAVNMIKKLGTLYGVHYSTQAATNLLMTILPNDIGQAIDEVKKLQGTTLEDFTKLVHLLAGKFTRTTTENIAKRFDAPIAQTYIDLGEQLLGVMFDDHPFKVSALIKNGADINFSAASYSFADMKDVIKSPLSVAIEELNVTAVEVLLRPGIKITKDALSRAEVLSRASSDEIKDWRPDAKGDEAKRIYTLLLEAELKKLKETREK